MMRDEMQEFLWNLEGYALGLSELVSAAVTKKGGEASVDDLTALQMAKWTAKATRRLREQRLTQFNAFQGEDLVLIGVQIGWITDRYGPIDDLLARLKSAMDG